MKQKTWKILAWLGALAVGVFIILAAVIYVKIGCWSKSVVMKDSLYFCACISSDLKNFPLTGLINEPEYSFYQMFGDFDNQSSNSVTFSSESTPEQIIDEAVKYLKSKDFEQLNDNCSDYPSCPKCCATFRGKESGVTIKIHPYIRNGEARQPILVSMTEEFYYR